MHVRSGNKLLSEQREVELQLFPHNDKETYCVDDCFLWC